MIDAGHEAHIFSWAGEPTWCTPRAPLLAAKDISKVDMTRFDFVVVSNAILIPMVLPHLGSAKCVFLALDYEAFHHSPEAVYESYLAESQVFKELYSLPVPIIATSRPIQRLIEERIGKPAYLMRVGIDKQVFHPQAGRLSSDRKRVLLVGNYLMPYKGMRDGFAALDILSSEMPVELVLVTQEERDRRIFEPYSWPIEIHFCPAEADIPAIIATCDVYCCTSWYEGLGLPALEAFCCGTPVVSTRTIGVDDYAEDGVNLLLASPNDPADLAEKLRRVLTDAAVRERLVAGGFDTVARGYDWSTAAKSFLDAIAEIDSSYEGAGDVDPRQMQGYLDRLEESGSFTPIEVFREFELLAERLQSIADDVSTSQGSENLGELAQLRDRLNAFLQNENAQYYDAFKAKFDFAQLLLALSGTADDRFISRLVDRRRGRHNGSNADSLTEIRYT